MTAGSGTPLNRTGHVRAGSPGTTHIFKNWREPPKHKQSIHYIQCRISRILGLNLRYSKPTPHQRAYYNTARSSSDSFICTNTEVRSGFKVQPIRVSGITRNHKDAQNRQKRCKFTLSTTVINISVIQTSDDLFQLLCLVKLKISETL